VHGRRNTELKRSLAKATPLFGWQREALSKSILEELNNLDVSKLVLSKEIIPDADSVMVGEGRRRE